MKPGSTAGFDSFNEVRTTHLKQAGFKRQTLTGDERQIIRQLNFLKLKRNPTMVAQIVDIIKTEYLLSQDSNAELPWYQGESAKTHQVVPLKPTTVNIVMVKLVISW